MFNDLTEIKRIRKRLGLNQKELAERAELSQSLIAKIEAGKIEPTYNKVRRIFEVLHDLESKEEVKAKDLMNTDIVSVGLNDQVKKVIVLMKEKGISQVPVIEEGKACGLVSEKAIVETIAEGKGVGEMKVEEIMEDCPPTVSQETSQRILLELLKAYSIVLIGEKGEIKGLISKSDLLGSI